MGPLPQSRTGCLREQILLHPDAYIGSMEKRTQKLWVCSKGGFSMEERAVTYVPGLLQIFDEILVYAADNKRRDPTGMDTLRVDVDVASCRISVFNSGKGVPIEVVHGGEEGVYVPELVFGNHQAVKEEDIVTGSKNNDGYGVKLANIFSTKFVVEIADGPGKKKYRQVFSENMGNKSNPEVTCYRKGVSWTMVTFSPDLAKFNLTYLEEDLVDLMRKRVFDMAGTLLGGTSKVQLVFNGQTIYLHPSFGFRDYVHQYVKSGSVDRFPWLFEEVNDQWEVGVCVSEGQFQQVSFVNNVATVSGGTHVDYVSNLILTRALGYMKDTLQLRGTENLDVKRHLMVFVNLLVENPTFSSPTKELLTTPQEDWVRIGAL